MTPSDPHLATAFGPVGFGSACLGNLYATISDEQAAATVRAAWGVGVRAYDTAPHDGRGRRWRRRAVTRRSAPGGSRSV